MEPGALLQSSVRIYCDNDAAGSDVHARWQLYPDIMQLPVDRRNSNLPPDQQMWWDPINEIIRQPGDYGIRYEPNSMAQLWNNVIRRQPDPSRQPLDRSVLCVSIGRCSKSSDRHSPTY